MKPRFYISAYTSSNDVMLCTTVEQLTKFYEHLDENGYKWCTGYGYKESPLCCSNAYLKDGKMIGIHFNVGRWGVYDRNASCFLNGNCDERFLYYDDFIWCVEESHDALTDMETKELMNLLGVTERG